MSRYIAKQEANIIAYAERNNIDVSTVNAEDFVTVDFFYGNSSCDICGRPNIAWIYQVKHKNADEVMHVGSECVKNYRFLNLHGAKERVVRREIARQKRREREARKEREFSAIAQQWRDDNRDLIEWLEAHCDDWWNRKALQRINSWQWVKWGNPAPISEKWLQNIKKCMSQTNPSLKKREDGVVINTVPLYWDGNWTRMQG